ncbi:MAG: OmpA family protein [Clostridiales bacterium]|jgi:chemotaxis protein MotB|nr:OmpA family protein [Clostridiales bacterium]
MKEEHEPPENHERWLISYADFITLLMVFFVVLYSMSKVDVAKYEQLSQSLNSALSGGISVLDNPPAGMISPDTNGSGPIVTPGGGKEGTEGEESGREEDTGFSTGISELQDMQTVKKELQTYFAEHNLDASISLSIDERGLVVSLNDTILFDPGSSDLKSTAQNRLTEIGGVLNLLENYIRVEGHTDNVPISSSRYASNWELSALRATTVVRLLTSVAGIPAGKLSAVGYGEYKPIADNSTPEGRSMNRRVDIILLSSKYDKLEA